MKALHAIASGLLITVALAFGALAVFAGLRGPEGWSGFLETAGVNRWVWLAAGSAVLLLGLLWLVTVAPRRSRQFATFQTDGGEVSVAVSAIRDYLAQLLDEWPPVLSVRPVVRPAGKSLEVTLDIRVQAGAEIPEVSRTVQERSRERLERGLGLPGPTAIRVRVTEIVGNPAAPKRLSAGDPRSADPGAS